MRKLLFLGILALFTNQTLCAQWIQNEALTGGSMINDIISYNGKIYAAISDNGLYSSSDNGDSWSHVDVGHDWSIDRLEVHKDQILAATSQHVFKSSDGINWEDITIEGSFVKEIYSDGVNIYLATLTGGVFKSIDDGNNWIDINDELTSEGVEAFAKAGDILYAGKRDNTGIIFKSTDDGQSWEEIIIEEGKWIKEIRANSDGIYVNLTEYVLFSNDNGLSWSKISGALTGHRITQLIAQEGIVYANANGQIFSTIDNGGNWKSSQNYLSGFNCTALHINDNNIFVGMWGGGIARNTIALDQEWSSKNEGLILNYIHCIGLQGDSIFVGTESNFVRTSIDKGKTWSQEVDYFGLKNGRASSMTIYKNVVYVGGRGEGVRKKNHETGIWDQANKDLPGKIVYDLCSNDENIFVAIDGEGVYRSDNPTQGWIKKGIGISSSIRKLYTSGKYIFACTWNGLFFSENDGETWIDISNDLPDKSINSIVYIDSSILFQPNLMVHLSLQILALIGKILVMKAYPI